MVDWLETNLSAAMAALPERDLSYLEISLFCFLEHLEFREVMKLDRHPQISAFRNRFAARPSAVATQYRYDS
jgi:glutathione S-transferase